MAYDIGPQIGIAGEKEFNEQIKLLNKNLKALDAEMNAVTSAYDKNDVSMDALIAKKSVLTKSIDTQTQKLNAVSAQYDKQKSKLQELAAELEKAKREFGENSTEAIRAESAYKKQAGVLETLSANIHTTTANLNQMNKELVEVNNARLEKLSQELDEVGEKMQSTGRKMTVLSAAITAGAVAAAKAAMDFESAFAGVEKTVDGTEEQLAKISAGIRQMAKEIPASVTEIAAVAEAAGQLGIATEDILSFTRVMIDLGESTNLAADEAATSLAKFANITRMSADDHDRLGSTIVALGNNMATTERDIVSMATRLASTGELVGLTETQILALSATLSSLGIEAEAGGSALARLLKQFETMVATGDGLEDFAKIAGKSAQEFAATWREDPIKALTAFFQGLGEVDKAGGSAVKVLDDLGIKEVRLSNAVLAMAASGDLITESIELANKAWNENIALQTEAEKRYRTTESQIQIAKNTINDIAITMGSEFLPIVNDAIASIRDLGEWFAGLDTAGKETIIRILAIIAALGPMVAITGKAITAVKGLTTAIAAYKTAAAVGATATAALGAAMNATPVGLLASGIALLGSVIVGSLISNAITATEKVNELTETTEQASQTLKDINSEFARSRDDISVAADLADTYITRLEELERQGLQTVESQKEYRGIIDTLKGILPDLNIQIDEQTGLLANGTQALRENTEAWKENALAQAFAEQYQALYDQYADVLIERTKNQNALNEAEARAAVVSRELVETQKQLEEGYKNVETMSREEVEALDDLAAKARDLEKEKDELTRKTRDYSEAIEQNDEVLAEYETQLGELDQTKATLINTTEDEIHVTEEATQSTEEFIAAVEDLAAVNEDLSKSVEKASKAFEEQKENGSLSLSTILDLIHAGYAAALAIDAETGAVTLNKDAYIELTKTKIESQIADLEALKTDLAQKLQDEGKMARETAGDFAVLAATKSLANDADYQSYKSTEAQIAALKQLRDNLVNVGTAATTSSKKTSDAAKKKSEAFANAVKDIQYQLDMELISEEEFWQQYEELRDKHLKENSDEWKDATVKLHQWKKEQEEKQLKEEENLHKKQVEEVEKTIKELRDQYEQDYIDRTEFLTRSEEIRDRYLEENSKAWISTTESIFETISEIESERLEKMVDNYQKAYDEILADQERMASNLAGYGKLFDEGQLTDLEDQIDALTKYGDQLEDLRKRGISDTLMDEIIVMSIDEANQYMENLLSLTDTEWENYISLWEEKQRLAQETAEKFYKSQLDTLEAGFSDKLIEELSDLSDQTFDIGQEAANALAEGILSAQDTVAIALRDVVSAAISAIKAPPINYNANHNFVINPAPVVIDGRVVGQILFDPIKEQEIIRGTNLIEGG